MLLALGALYVLAVSRASRHGVRWAHRRGWCWDLRWPGPLHPPRRALAGALVAGTTHHGEPAPEDLLFPVLILSWLLRILVHRERPVFRTPLTAPMVAITLWGLAVTLLGTATGTVPHGSDALFRFAKYTQYYLIFFLVYNNVHSFVDIRRMTMVFIVAGALTGLLSIYGA